MNQRSSACLYIKRGSDPSEGERVNASILIWPHDIDSTEIVDFFRAFWQKYDLTHIPESFYIQQRAKQGIKYLRVTVLHTRQFDFLDNFIAHLAYQYELRIME